MLYRIELVSLFRRQSLERLQPESYGKLLQRARACVHDGEALEGLPIIRWLPVKDRDGNELSAVYLIDEEKKTVIFLMLEELDGGKSLATLVGEELKKRLRDVIAEGVLERLSEIGQDTISLPL